MTLDSAPQMGFEVQPIHGPLVHVLAVEREGVGAGFLGPIHGDVGQAQQGFGIGAVVGINADADRGADLVTSRAFQVSVTPSTSSAP